MASKSESDSDAKLNLATFPTLPNLSPPPSASEAEDSDDLPELLEALLLMPRPNPPSLNGVTSGRLVSESLRRGRRIALAFVCRGVGVVTKLEVVFTLGARGVFRESASWLSSSSSVCTTTHPGLLEDVELPRDLILSNDSRGLDGGGRGGADCLWFSFPPNPRTEELTGTPDFDEVDKVTARVKLFILGLIFGSPTPILVWSALVLLRMSLTMVKPRDGGGLVMEGRGWGDGIPVENDNWGRRLGWRWGRWDEVEEVRIEVVGEGGRSFNSKSRVTSPESLRDSTRPLRLESSSPREWLR